MEKSRKEICMGMNVLPFFIQWALPNAGILCCCALFFRTGFSGELCNYEYNECDSNPCLNDGQCTDHIGGFSCKCTRGFTGKRCHIKVSTYILLFILSLVRKPYFVVNCSPSHFALLCCLFSILAVSTWAWMFLWSIFFCFIYLLFKRCSQLFDFIILT